VASDSTTPTEATAERVASLLRHAVLSRAAELARDGRLEAAIDLLRSELQSPSPSPEALDFVARIRARQGAWAEAETLWLHVLRLDPNHRPAQAALSRVRAIRRAPFWGSAHWPAIVGALVLVACLLAVSLVIRREKAAAASLIHDVTNALMALGSATRTGLTAQHTDLVSLRSNLAALGAAQTTMGEDVSGLQASLAAQRALLNRLPDALRTAQETEHERVTAQVRTVLDFRAKEFEEASAAARSAQATQLLQLTRSLSSLSNALTSVRASSEEGLRRVETSIRGDLANLALPPSLREAGWPAVGPPSTAISAEWPDLGVEGVRQSVDGPALRLVFDVGLFDYGTSFRPGARDRLAAVGKALARLPGPLDVQSVGCAENERGLFGWKDSFALGLRRAVAAAEYLDSLAVLPDAHLSAASATGAALPFPNEIETDLPRNRTVYLRVWRGSP